MFLTIYGGFNWINLFWYDFACTSQCSTDFFPQLASQSRYQRVSFNTEDSLRETKRMNNFDVRRKWKHFSLFISWLIPTNGKETTLRHQALIWRNGSDNNFGSEEVSSSQRKSLEWQARRNKSLVEEIPLSVDARGAPGRFCTAARCLSLFFNAYLNICQALDISVGWKLIDVRSRKKSLSWNSELTLGKRTQAVDRLRAFISVDSMKINQKCLTYSIV